MVQMNLLAGQEQRRRGRGQTGRHRGKGRAGWAGSLGLTRVHHHG